MGFITWITDNWATVAAAISGLMVAAGMITGLFDGPKAAKAKGIFDYILTLLRSFGVGTYKDEPGTASIPFKGDTGERVVTTENIKAPK